MGIVIDNATYELTIGGTPWLHSVISDTLRWTEYEGGQTGALSLEVENDNLVVKEWQEVVVLRNNIPVWGGFVVRALPTLTEGGNRRWSAQCESWDTVLNRTPIVRRTYTMRTPYEIICDLLVATELMGWITPNGVDANLAPIATFSTNGDKLTDILDRLALLARVSWWLDAGRELHFQHVTSLLTAPYSIQALGQANFLDSFPPSGDPTPDIDATDIRNRVTVYGAQVPSVILTETFVGDGRSDRVTLSERPIHEIVKVTLDGVLQWHGYDWYDANFNDYQCLVDYTLGTVRWQNPLWQNANVEVQYRKLEQLVEQQVDWWSVAQYGRYFDFELRDSSLTNSPACIEAADAILAEYAFPSVGARLDVEWWGPRAGQRIEIQLPSLDLSGYYVIRQATIEIGRSTKTVLVSLKVGGRPARLSRVIGSERGSGSLIGPGAGTPFRPNPNLSGEIDLLRVRDRIELIDRNTTFDPRSYGDATGLVLLFDPINQQGKLLGLYQGQLQAYFDSDGRIKWDEGQSELNSQGLYISSSAFGEYGAQLESDGGTPRFYVGNGGSNYFQFDGQNASVGGYINAQGGFFSGSVYVGMSVPRIHIDGANKRIESTNFVGGSAGFRLAGSTGNAEFNDATLRGTIYAAGGHFSGSVYVGTANPRILIDGANKRIESTNFASGTSGFRIEGATGNAEFNNITARGAIASAVFTYNQVQATAGEIVVAKGAGKLRYDYWVSGGAASIIVEDPPGISHAAAGGLWSVNDIVRMKDPGVGDSWFKVLAVTDQNDQWSLLALWQAGNTLVTFKAATAVINYGQSGQGIVRISAAGSYTPYVSLATHAGSPWASLNEKARLGNLDGVSGASGYGLWTNNGYFTGVVQATSGLIGGWTIGTGKLSADGVGMEPATYPFYAGDNKASDAPFRVTPTGQLTASNAIITGAVTATSGTFTGTVNAGSGTIGNWTINSTYLAKDTGTNNTSSGMAPADFPFYAGSTYANRASAPFRVDPAGGLYATAGSVGGFTISFTEGLFSGTGTSRVQMKPGSGFWAGATARDDAPFRVTSAGALVATSATITGAITASSGSITGSLTMGASGSISDGTRWKLDSNGLVIASSYTDALQFRDTLTGTQRMTVGYSSGYAQVTAFNSDLALVAGTNNANVILSAPGTGEIRAAGILNHTGNKLGFFSATPVVRPSAYTFTNGAADRAINCTSTTLGEVANVLFTMWTDLKNLGLLQ